MKVEIDQEALLDRGGRPTLRELLSHLVFSPVDGTLRLGKTRMVLQRTSFLSHLREEIVRRYGREDAFVLLTRLGFQAGVEDSRFVHASWPNLDLGDAFTAGTRLHTVSGIVKVETVHNDFDFRKGKFSGEFLWHESAEAAEHKTHYGPAKEPVCWSLVGYASGYATHSLGKLIVYKEVECEAMGHKHCRVIGKPAEVWGEDDPVVHLFREKIAMEDQPRRTPAQSVRQSGLNTHAANASDLLPDLQQLMISPVKAKIDMLTKLGVPLLVSGPIGSGKMMAAQYAARQFSSTEKPPHIVVCQNLDISTLKQALAPQKDAKGLSGPLILQDIDHLSIEAQITLENHLRTQAEFPFIVATMEASLPSLANTLRPALAYILQRAHVSMPALGERPDLIELAQALTDQLASRFGLQSSAKNAEALVILKSLPLDGNILELESILLDAMTDCHPDKEIDAKAISAAISRHGQYGKRPDGLSNLAGEALKLDGFSLDKLNEAIYSLALERAHGNISAAAKSLGLSRAKLAYRLGQVGGN